MNRALYRGQLGAVTDSASTQRDLTPLEPSKNRRGRLKSIVHLTALYATDFASRHGLGWTDNTNITAQIYYWLP